jgi:hypothetical protein
VQRVNPLALEWARPLTRMRAPSHGRKSGYLAKRGPGLSPCFGDQRGGRCSPSHIIHRMHGYCPRGKGFAYGLHLRATPGAGGSDRTLPGILLLPEQGEEECKTPAIRRSTGLSCAEAALRAAGRTRAAWCHPLHARKEAATPGPAAVCGAVWQWAAIAAGESPDPRFHRSAFSVGMDPRGSRALAHTPGRPDPSAGTILQVPSPCPCGCCSTRRSDAGGP